MKQNKLKLLLSLMMLCCASSAMAHDFVVNGIYYNKNGTEASVTYQGTSAGQYSDEYTGSVTIPSTVTYNGTTYSVTTIGSGAFSRCRNLTNITIATSVKSIDNSAFAYCSGLTSVIIPNSVTSIGTSSFSECSNLTSVTFGNSVTSIAAYAFDRCTSLTAVTIPNSVTSIGKPVFSGCNTLTSIKVNSGNSIYDSRNNCNAIIETASNTLIVGCKNTTIPNSVTAIGEKAFYCYNSLTGMDIPNSVTAIGNEAFALCYNLTNMIIPNSVTSIGFGAFTDCSLLTSVIIGSSVTSIGIAAFWECESLTSVNIPNSVTTIGEAAFWECSSLPSVTIPNSVTTIGNEAFAGCTGLTSITVESGNTTYDSRNNCNAIIKTASNTLITGCKNTTIPNSVTVIGDRAFYECTSLTNITIPNSVTAIGEASFYGCRGLTGVTIPNSVTTIGDYAFQCCSGITSVDIPNSVTAIGYSAFSQCSGLAIVICRAATPPTLAGSNIFSNYTTAKLYVPSASLQAYQATDEWNRFTNILSIDQLLDEKFEVDGIYYQIIDSEAVVTYRGTSYSQFNEYSGSVTIPSSVTYFGATYSVTSIGESAFRNCTGLTSVTIPNSVTTIGNNAFALCFGLTNVIIGSSVTTIGDYAFSGCSCLSNVTFGSSVTTIGNYAFSGCTGLTSVDIPNSVTTIGNHAFDSCTGLTSMDIPNSVTGIGNYAFYGCTGLTSVNIGNSVSAIGNNAFIYCTALTSVNIGNSVTTIGNSAFFGCTELTSLNIPNSVTTIGDKAFVDCSGLTSITVESGNTTYNSRNNCNAIIETASNTLIVGCKNSIIPNSVTAIGNYAFDGCTGLTNLNIPSSVTSIGNYAFRGCSGLTNVNIPNSVTSIGERAFLRCTGLTSLNIPNSVTSIGDYAFSGCSGLTSITVENGNTVYDSRDNCNAIIETASNTLMAGCRNTTIPNSVTAIGRGAFAGCTGLTSVGIPNAVTAIGDYAFESCTGLTSVKLPNSVTAISEGAFYYCSSLTSMTIPNSVNAIGEWTFYGCSGLTSVICKADTPPTMGGWWVFDDNSYSSATLYVPGESLQEYRTTDYWNQFTNILPMDSLQNVQFEVNGIYYYIIDNEAVVTYRGNSYYQYSNEYSGSVTIPPTVTHNGVTYPVTTIGESAFRGCNALTSVNIPNSVTTIEEEAFFYCSGLENVTFGNSVSFIGEEAFERCTSLTHLDFPNSLTYLDFGAFSNCTGLTSLTLPNSVTTIQEAAFDSCTGLTGELIIPNSVTYLGEAAFVDCSGLTSATILAPITRINDELFFGCSSLTSVSLPNTITYIGDASFEDCSSLTEFIIPEAVDSIIYSAFMGCSSLKSINIPNSVTYIGKHVFSECTSLTSVTIGNSVAEILDDAFGGCTNLTSVICKAVTPPAMGDIDVFDNYDYNNTYSKATLYVPAASLQAYRNTDYWNRFTTILPIEDYTTAMPTITSELSIGAMTVAASGVGTVVLRVDGVVVENPCDIPRTDQDRIVTVTATAQEDGKFMSDIATLTLTIPAIMPLNTDNYLTMSDTTLVRGATVMIPVRMINAATIVSFQTDISLAGGLEVAQADGDYIIEPSGRMTRTHAITSNQLSNGDIRVLCYSSNYKAFTGNSGDILFYIAVRGTAAEEGDHIITLKNTLFTDRDFEELRAPDASATVHVLPYLRGDANGSGTVTVTDVVVTAQRVLELDPQPFVFEGADVNEDGIISVTDVTRIAYMVLNEATLHAPMRAPVLWNNGDCLSAEAINLAPGETRTVALWLDNELEYAAMQLDLRLPDGLTASNFRLADRASGLTLDANIVEGGATRLLCYSPALTAISGSEGVLLTFDVTATDHVKQYITVDNIELVTTDCRTVKLDSFSIGVNDATDVNEVTADIKIYGCGNDIVIETPSATTITVSDMLGRTRTISVEAGKTVIAAEDGVYIVTAGMKAVKLMLR